jgi:hypothetical protein
MSSKDSLQVRFSSILNQFDRGVSRRKLLSKLVSLLDIDINEPLSSQIEDKLGRKLTEAEDFKVQLIYEEAMLAHNPEARTLGGLR